MPVSQGPARTLAASSSVANVPRSPSGTGGAPTALTPSSALRSRPRSLIRPDPPDRPQLPEGFDAYAWPQDDRAPGWAPVQTRASERYRRGQRPVTLELADNS